MRPADLHQCGELVIGHAPHKMHAVQNMRASGVDLAAQLVKDRVFPTLGPFRGCAVANLITANNHHLRVWPFCQNTRQGAHENMVAPIRFQIAIDEG